MPCISYSLRPGVHGVLLQTKSHIKWNLIINFSFKYIFFIFKV